MLCLDVCYFFFFFKQKTAYEMRISDWSSDVCSSDLVALRDFHAIRAHYYDASGAPKPVGARIKNPELARLLKHVAKHGAPGFYQGWPARRLSSAVATAPRNPSQLTEADLIAYRAEERRSEEHTSELQTLMRTSYAVFCLK